MASRSPCAIRAIRLSSEAACVALNGRLARLVGSDWGVVRSEREDSTNYSNNPQKTVIFRTELPFPLRGAPEVCGILVYAISRIVGHFGLWNTLSGDDVADI